MDTIILILLFLAPGMTIMRALEIKAKREKKRRIETTIYEQLFTVCVLSIFATGITCAIINILRIIKKVSVIATVDEMTEKLNTFNFLIEFLFVMTIATAIVGWAYSKILKCYTEAKNKSIEKQFNLSPLGEDNPTVWEDIFLNVEKNSNPRIASIYKDGQYITSGYIDGWNLASNERKEFIIRRSTEIEKIMKLTDTPLDYIDEEYFDMETGVLVKFWRSEIVNKHWDDIMDNRINK